MYRWLIGRIVKLGYQRLFEGKPRLMLLATAPDVAFTFPGTNSFAANLTGRDQLKAWLDRFVAFQPSFDVCDVIVTGAPWNTRIAVRFADAIGDDYTNNGVEWVEMRWGKVTSVQVSLDTERIAAWESRHPELAAA